MARSMIIVLAMAGLSAAAGCINPTAVFADDFLQAFGAVPSAASLPGEAPSLVIGVRNDTGRVIEYQLSFRNSAGEIDVRSGALPASGEGVVISTAQFCPVSEVTLGDVSNLTTTGAVVRLGSGLATDPFVQVEPFGVLLQEGVQYSCGDRITFRVASSSATPSGFRVFATIERTGS